MKSEKNIEDVVRTDDKHAELEEVGIRELTEDELALVSGANFYVSAKK